jgi:hypothetical protein
MALFLNHATNLRLFKAANLLDLQSPMRNLLARLAFFCTTKLRFEFLIRARFFAQRNASGKLQIFFAKK